MKTLNKNKKLLKHPKGYVIIDIISSPKYHCQGKTFSEYDIRNLQVQISKGYVSHVIINDLHIKDAYNNSIVFREDGKLTSSPFGYDTTSKMVIEMLKDDRRKKGV